MYKILLAEDDSALRFVYSKKKVWNDCGFVIADAVSNGRDALLMLEKNNYDLVLTDIRMPFMDGIELLREIKNRGINVCVAFVSSYDDFEYARQGLVLGAFDYILKPADDKKITELLERVKKNISAKSTLSETVIKAAKNSGIDTSELSESDRAYKFIKYFSDNYERIFTMEEMAEYFGFNKDYFGKIFRQSMNISFVNFYSSVKIEYAKELIRTGNYKNYDISEMLGYSSADYFTKVFKEFTGKTPTEFKNDPE